jgi:hypothetical protein
VQLYQALLSRVETHPARFWASRHEASALSKGVRRE